MLDLSHISSRKAYLLAISGGRDSVCLLHLLLAYGFRKLHLVHLNHQLRGSAADGDEAFVKELAKKNDLSLTVARVPVGQLADENGLSIETAARNARHQLFAQAARKTQISRVLLAHHAEDQAETILFNLLRGSSGLRGMEPESALRVGRKTLHLFRPLLGTRRSEMDCYLTSNKVAFREDASNQDPAHTRNRLRNEALPLLEKIMARDIVPQLLRAAESTREQEGIVTSLLDTLELLDPQDRLFLPKLRTLSPELQLACLKQYLSRNQVKEISQRLLSEARTLISPGGPPAVNLPGNRYLRRRQGRIFVS